MSADLQWLILRNTSSFIVKRKNAPTMTTEPNNVKGRNSLRFSGLVRKKTVGVEAAESNKGVVLVLRNSGSRRKPAANYRRVELKKNARSTMKTISKTLRNGRYRQDLRMCAMRKASAILRSQQPVVAKKKRTRAATKKSE